MSMSYLILYLCEILKKKDPQNNERTWDLNHKLVQRFLQKLPVYILGKTIVQDVACFGWSATWMQDVSSRDSMGTEEFWS